jgi:hypothetical protein
LEVNAVSRRFRTHAVGIIFFILVAISVLLSVIGIRMAHAAHVATWALLLFYSVLSMAVPLGGSIGYLFYIPRRDDDT